MASNSKCYELTLKEKPVGFIAMKKFIHPIVKNMFMISRIVILPEYQGFGLAIKFMEIISQKYFNLGNKIRIVTSLKPFINALKKNKKFKLLRFCRHSKGSYTGKIHNNKKQKSTSHNRITASFEYIGDKNA